MTTRNNYQVSEKTAQIVTVYSKCATLFKELLNEINVLAKSTGNDTVKELANDASNLVYDGQGEFLRAADLLLSEVSADMKQVP